MYALANGRERNKGISGGGGVADTGSWDTITLFTANKGFNEALSRENAQTNATAVRVLEWYCDFPRYAGTDVKPYIDACMGATYHNYGLAGPIFIKWLLKNQFRLNTLSDKCQAWRRNKNFLDEERVWANGLFMALTAGRFAVEIGLLDYNMDALEKWCLKHLVPANRELAQSNKVNDKENLSDYLNTHLRDMIIVRSADRTKNQVDPGVPGLPDPYVVVNSTSGQLSVRFEQDSCTFYVSKAAMKEWCVKHKLSLNTMLENLKREQVYLGARSKTLAKNISWVPQFRTAVLVFNGKLIDCEDFNLKTFTHVGKGG
jgi:hypothetical protein